MLANPRTPVYWVAAAQFSAFSRNPDGRPGANCNGGIPGVRIHTPEEAASIAIIGGAEAHIDLCHSATWLRILLAECRAAYAYMALVPMIKPPINARANEWKERSIRDDAASGGHKTEKIISRSWLFGCCGGFGCRQPRRWW